MVDTAFTYGFSNGNTRRYLIGTAFLYLSWLLFPLVFLFGYYIRVLTTISKGKTELPPITDGFETGKQALYGIVVIFTYGAFLFAAPMFTVAVIGIRGFQPVASADPYLLNGFLLSGVVFGVAFLLVLPVLLYRSGQAETFTDIYDITSLVTVLRGPEVLKAMLTTVTLTTVVLGTTGLTVVLTKGIALTVLPFILFWYMLATAYLYGRAINAEREQKTMDSQNPAENSIASP